VARAFVGLGSNLGDRESVVREALRRLDALEGVTVVGVSTLRETDPVGYVDQPRFLNGAAEVETTLRPRALLEALLEVERSLGRTRTGPRYGPRVIDLDLLLYEDEALEERGLTVPHPRLHERAFALEPLLELDPALAAPRLGPLAPVLRKLQSD